MSYDELAATLDRTVETIKDVAENKLGLNIDGKSKILYNAKRDVENREYWKQLEGQFTEEELRLFVYHWGLIYDQFREDITHTEELQIVELIKLMIMGDRNLSAQKDLADQIRAIKTTIENERSKDNPDNTVILSLERQIAGFYQANGLLTKEYHELVDEKNNIMKALKGTREGRLKNMEDSKESIVVWFRNAIDNRELRIRMGLSMEKMRLAMEAERERLGANYTYANGEIDRPFLCPDIVLKEEK